MIRATIACLILLSTLATGCTNTEQVLQAQMDVQSTKIVELESQLVNSLAKPTVKVAQAAIPSTATPSPTPRPTFTPVPEPTATPVPEPYIVTSYPQENDDGSLWEVHKWSDGRFTHDVLREPSTPTPEPNCVSVIDSRVTIQPWRYFYWNTYLEKGDKITVNLDIYGGNRDASVRFWDSNESKMGEIDVRGSDSAWFVAPYADTFRIDVYNSFWSQQKTVEVSAVVCRN